MKNCPNCGEILGDSVKECFKCHYNYSFGRVLTSLEISEQRKMQENSVRAKAEREQYIQQHKSLQLEKNPLFEYETVIINDTENGLADSIGIQNALTSYSKEGWRLHSIFTNEVGKNSVSATVAFLGANINATIDQTILIFERCIKM